MRPGPPRRMSKGCSETCSSGNSWDVRFASDEPVPRGEGSGFAAAMNLHLVEDVRNVMVNRAQTHEEVFSDLWISEPLTEERENFPLAAGEVERRYLRLTYLVVQVGDGRLGRHAGTRGTVKHEPRRQCLYFGSRLGEREQTASFPSSIKVRPRKTGLEQSPGAVTDLLAFRMQPVPHPLDEDFRRAQQASRLLPVTQSRTNCRKSFDAPDNTPGCSNIPAQQDDAMIDRCQSHQIVSGIQR